MRTILPAKFCAIIIVPASIHYTCCNPCGMNGPERGFVTVWGVTLLLIVAIGPLSGGFVLVLLRPSAPPR
jgi:hypothetical protein